MPKVSVVILNWNRKDDTIECLKSLSKVKVQNFALETVVVDNASSDGSVKAIKDFLLKHKRLHGTLIENKENLGYAGGNNVGIKHALEKGADFVTILNNDTILPENILTSFVEAAGKHEKAGILSPKIYFAKGYEFHKEDYRENELGKVIWYVGGVIDWANVIGSNYGVDDVDVGQYHLPREIDFATGACMFVKAKVLKEVGLFDEKFFLYLEDADLSLRVKKAGWKILFIPDVYLWHKVSQSSGIGSGLNDYYITRNRLLFGLRYAPLRSKFALIRESLKLLVSGRRWQKAGVADFYKAQFGKGSFSA